MIRQQQSIQLSSYMGIYDLVVPKDNLLRRLIETADFSFVYNELKDNILSKRR
jgi:hypothetical protein